MNTILINEVAHAEIRARRRPGRHPLHDDADPGRTGAEYGAGVEAEEGEVTSRLWRELLGRYIFGLQE